MMGVMVVAFLVFGHHKTDNSGSTDGPGGGKKIEAPMDGGTQAEDDGVSEEVGGDGQAD